MMKLLVIATRNEKKAGEMVQILKERLPGLDLRTLADYPHAPEPEETGSTYEDNALIKARSALQATGQWALADDAGLEIDALPGCLGVHSKRFEGEQTTFAEKMRVILERMDGLPTRERSARFRCDVALVGPDGTEIVIEDTCEGRIAEAPSGAGGFGYDPIFFLPELGCTMASLSAAQKHEISHRGKVLRKLADCLADG
ncbi:MAG: RdgB/HAM1 family non-canonical purine NTP pyrophosphatase [Armatimonadetes bacterium]|nr:RdgB/HAM1 family non-canonical purine NTP pyrophosphatase [Armatimonadota bacterium]